MTEEKEVNWKLEEKNWYEFRNSGLLLFINSFLHIFGWAIVCDVEYGVTQRVYPARVKYRGFTEDDQDTAHKKLARYMVKNAVELQKETEL